MIVEGNGSIGRLRVDEQGVASENHPTISIIIPTKGRPDDLLETVRSIACQDRLPDELIIIDQSAKGCEEEVLAIVKNCPSMKLKYFWVPEVPGLVEARNKGIAEASGDIIFFVDDDITMDPDCIKNLSDRYVQHPEYAGICAVDVGGASVPWWLVLARRAYMLGPFRDDRSLMNKRYKKNPEPKRVRLVSGGYMSYRRRIFDEFQFEGKLWGHRWNSSIDLSYRVSEKYPVVIDPQVRARHRKVYGTYSPEEFVRVRVSGTFFFFTRNVKKKRPWGWICFLWVLFAIFIRSIWWGLQTRALGRTLVAFFSELYKGVEYIRHPFPAPY